jgi:hypothetical protein
MKKILAGLTLAIMAVVFLAPVVMAQETIPAEIRQCTMRHDLKDVALCGTAGQPECWSKKGFTCPFGATLAEKACSFDNSSYTCGTCCVLDTVYTVTDWLFLGIVVIAGIMILIGAFNIVTAGGSPEKVNTGRSFIIFAAVGIIIALIAKLIPTIAKNIIGLG